MDESRPAALGLVVPKRHARRAVTRSLLKRSMQGAVLRWQARLRGGLWVLRLKAPFDPARYPSAASRRLAEVAGAELDALLGSLRPR